MIRKANDRTLVPIKMIDNNTSNVLTEDKDWHGVIEEFRELRVSFALQHIMIERLDCLANVWLSIFNYRVFGTPGAWRFRKKWKWKPRKNRHHDRRFRKRWKRREKCHRDLDQQAGQHLHSVQ